MNLPIELTEIEVTKDWKPEPKKKYLVLYEWKKGDEFWMIGHFTPVWYGFSFHWYWSASSLQFSEHDWMQFKRIYLFEPHPEPDFIGKEEIEL
jgi:hypothetical protein